MKAIVCELCGSNDVIKQGEYFICQSCGTKYEPEAAKKLLVEVDNSAKLENLYTLARRAKDEDNAENAAKYYGQILEHNSDDWEAYFYSAFYTAQKTTIANMSVSASNFSRAIPTSFELLCKTNLSQRDIENNALLMAAHCQDLGLMMGNVALKQQKEYMSISADTALRYEPEFRSNMAACCSMLIAAGDAIEKSFILNDNDPNGRMKEKALEVWQNALDTSVGANSPMLESDISNRIEKYTGKTQYKWLVDTRVTLNEYNEIITIIKSGNEIAAIKRLRELTGWELKRAKEYTEGVLLPAAGKPAVAPQSSTNNSDGCYVATAVYGSYDCPEVWTLRRYRDFKLSRNAFGRAFIRAYYAFSPRFVDWFVNADWFKKACKGKLDKLVEKLIDRGFENTPYSDIDWRR